MSRKIVIASLVLTALIVGTAALSRISGSELFRGPTHDSIADLQQLPNGPVRLRGVVTYADTFRKRFWIQDDTGAIAVESPPTGIEAGQVVEVQARKTHAYNPSTGLASVALADFRIRGAKQHSALPTPAAATLRNLPQREKNGIRIQLTEVIYYLTEDESGLPVMAFGDSGYEAWVVLPGNSRNLPINATVQLTAVSELDYHADGSIAAQHLWAQNSNEVVVLQGPPESAAMYSVRSLYRDPKSRDGHKIRLRGKVTAANNSHSLVVEDSWGAIACYFDGPPTVPIGTAVEVTGFPRTDGPRIQINHSNVTWR